MTKGPYQSPHINEMMANFLAERGVRTSGDPEALTRIALIGGVTDLEGRQILTDDRETLYGVCDQLSRAGLKVSSRPQILFYNILPPAQNDYTDIAAMDYVPAEHCADIAIASALPIEGVSKKIAAAAIHLGFKNPDSQVYRNPGAFGHERLAAVSERHFQKNVWEQSAVKSGAKVVATRGGLQEEISISHFTGDHNTLTTVVNTFEGLPLQRLSPYMDRKAQIPGGVGFAIRRDYAAQIAEQLTAEGHFGERLVQKLQKIVPQNQTINELAFSLT